LPLKKLKVKLRKVGIFLLLSLFVQAIIPELIHECTGHEDTIEHPASGTHISIHHIHCESLQDNLPAFTAAQIIFPPSSEFILNEKIIQPVLFKGQLFQFHFQLRGPPAVV